MWALHVIVLRKAQSASLPCVEAELNYRVVFALHGPYEF